MIKLTLFAFLLLSQSTTPPRPRLVPITADLPTELEMLPESILDSRSILELSNISSFHLIACANDPEILFVVNRIPSISQPVPVFRVDLCGLMFKTNGISVEIKISEHVFVDQDTIKILRGIKEILRRILDAIRPGSCNSYIVREKLSFLVSAILYLNRFANTFPRFQLESSYALSAIAGIDNEFLRYKAIAEIVLRKLIGVLSRHGGIYLPADEDGVMERVQVVPRGFLGRDRREHNTI